MANDDYREQHERDRAAGLAARHETRVERAIRRQVADELIADEIVVAALAEFEQHGRIWSGPNSSVWACRCGMDLPGMGEPGSSDLARKHVLIEILRTLARVIGAKETS